MSDEETRTGPVVINASDVEALTEALGSQRAPSRYKMKKDARDRKAVKLYEQGVSVKEIQVRLGFNSTGAVSSAIRRISTKQNETVGETYRRAEAARLDEANEVIMAIIREQPELPGALLDSDDMNMDRLAERVVDIISNDREVKLKAIDRLFKSGERAGKLFGYEAASKVENSGATGTFIVQFPESMNVVGMAEPVVVVDPQK